MRQKICPVCGHLEEAFTEYCSECGAKTIDYDDGTGEPKEAEKKAPGQKRQEAYTQDGQDGASNASGAAAPSQKGVPLGLIGVGALVVIVGLFFANKHILQDDDMPTTASEQPASDEDPQSQAEETGPAEGGSDEPGEGSVKYELIVREDSWSEERGIWDQAYEECVARGGHLVKIDSEEEAREIWQQIVDEGKENVECWIGEVDATTNGAIYGYYEINEEGYSSTGDVDIETYLRVMQAGGIPMGYICEYGDAPDPGQIPEQTPEPTPESTPAPGSIVEEGVNTYELIVADVSWTEAYYDCLNRGGHLVRITSDEEYQAILQQIDNEGKKNIIFWLGGARNENSGYYWIYDEGNFGVEVLNEDEKYASYWLDGEPSFHDDTANADETRMNMFRLSSSGRWVWNDVPDDILSVASFYSGKIGYICEYE